MFIGSRTSQLRCLAYKSEATLQSQKDTELRTLTQNPSKPILVKSSAEPRNAGCWEMYSFKNLVVTEFEVGEDAQRERDLFHSATGQKPAIKESNIAVLQHAVSYYQNAPVKIGGICLETTYKIRLMSGNC
ncbi:hypothetical protein Y1Q_0008293 [Alligator mississippiensis]|uniref:Uncharacterized protein n=1 Tax=Alligator mississippiensis TaxID=8496 RepID=A0A151N1G4_ALLMI|nr:hypothetical protein Y1Q_0008293 [Alligator mississippiensis]